MNHRPLLAVLALAVLSPAPAQAQAIKTQVFLIPYNSDSTGMATKVGGMMEKVLKKDKEFKVVDLSEQLGGKPSEAVDQARKQAIKFLEKGIKKFGAVEFDGAVKDLTQSLAVFRSQAAWLHRIPEYKDALAYLGATYVLKGDETEARAVFKELLLYAPSYKLDPVKFDPSLTNIMEQVAEQIRTGPVGSISVYSKPVGARIFIDGVHKGFTPASLERIPTGKHVLRLEAMGTFPYGEVIEVTPTEDKAIRTSLDATDEFKKIQTIIRQIGKELQKGNVGAGMTKLGNYLSLDWAIYGVVTHDFGDVTVDAWVVSIPHSKRLASLRTNFPDSDFNLDKNVEQYLKDLFRDARARQTAVSHGGKGTVSDDPLDNKTGLEDWSGDSKKRRSLDVSGADVTSGDLDDPLDGMDGTEDW